MEETWPDRRTNRFLEEGKRMKKRLQGRPFFWPESEINRGEIFATALLSVCLSPLQVNHFLAFTKGVFQVQMAFNLGGEKKELKSSTFGLFPLSSLGSLFRHLGLQEIMDIPSYIPDLRRSQPERGNTLRHGFSSTTHTYTTVRECSSLDRKTTQLKLRWKKQSLIYKRKSQGQTVENLNI